MLEYDMTGQHWAKKDKNKKIKGLWDTVDPKLKNKL